MQNIPSELIITVKNYINITSFKMKESPDLGQAVLLLWDNKMIFNLFYYFVWHGISHDGSVPGMRIWSILLTESRFKMAYASSS